MDVYAKYFRRLLTGNSHIFSTSSRPVETPGNYGLLVQEIEKASQDPNHAKKVADVIDTSEGDALRDFDLATFLAHFKLHPARKTILLAAFTHAGKPDLRAKGHYSGSCVVSMGANNFCSLFRLLQYPTLLAPVTQQHNTRKRPTTSPSRVRGVRRSSRHS